MIQETIVTTRSQEGQVHIAPMGIHVVDEGYLILPFRPSATLENILESHSAVINFTDDVRVFAGCLTGRQDWETRPAFKIKGSYLANSLSHTEVELLRVEESETRPKLFCKPVYRMTHAPFNGFNRAQYSVLEAAILVSRLDMLPFEKIESELAYLLIGLNKTAGERELEAWDWLMQKIEQFRRQKVLNP